MAFSTLLGPAFPSVCRRPANIAFHTFCLIRSTLFESAKVEIIGLIIYLIAGHYARPKKDDRSWGSDVAYGMWVGCFPLNAAADATIRVVKDAAGVGKAMIRSLPAPPDISALFPRKPAPVVIEQIVEQRPPTAAEVIEEYSQAIEALQRLPIDEDTRTAMANEKVEELNRRLNQLLA
jgi:hypothetical protein